jgi:peroxiredoxin
METLVGRCRRTRRKRVRRAILGAALALACLALGSAAVTAAAPDIPALMRDFGVGPLSGEPSPVALPDLAGERVDLQNQRGHLVMLYFWATWCPYCTREMPSTMETIHRELRDQGLTILAINLGESRALVAPWIEQRHITFPVLLDESGAVAGAYRVRGTPTVVLVDRQGRLLGRTVGSREWDTEGRPLLAALLAARPQGAR